MSLSWKSPPRGTVRVETVAEDLELEGRVHGPLEDDQILVGVRVVGDVGHHGSQAEPV
jgi:hypothetical protein